MLCLNDQANCRAVCRVLQKTLRLTNPAFHHILHRRHAELLLKHMRQIILAHVQSLRHHTQRDRLTVVCIQIAPHAVRQHRRHFTLLLLLVDTTAEQGIGQIQHCLCQTAAHGMQVSRIGAEQIQQVHGLAYLPGKLSARDNRMFINIFPNCLAPLIVQASLGFSNAILDTPFCDDQAVGRQTFCIDIGNCDAVRPIRRT